MTLPPLLDDADGLLVSVVIPVYDGEAFLGEALDSVRSQTYPHLEIIVVDDGSTDASADVAASVPGVRVIRQANQGQAAARNAGVAAASGRAVAFLDADDVWLPDKLARQVAALRDRPTAGVVAAHVRQVFDDRFQADIAERYRIPRAVMPGHIPSALLVRMEVFQMAGGFDPTWRRSEAIAWLAAVRDASVDIVMLPEVLVHRRIHGRNTGIRFQDERAEYARNLKAVLDRRRAAQGGGP